METALQQAIEKTKNTIAELKARQDKVSHQNRIQVEFIEFKIQALEDNLLMLQSLLPKEREQMKKARENGFTNGVSHQRHNYVIQDFEQYYETNFNK